MGTGRKYIGISDNQAMTNSKAEYFYLCDGRACNRNCAEVGFAECRHTQNESHAKNKIRRERKFTYDHGFMVEE